MVGEEEGVRNLNFQPPFPLILSMQHANRRGIRALGEKKGGMAIIKEWCRGGGLIRPNFKILLGAVFHFFPSSSVYSSTYTLVLLSSRFCSAAFPFDVEANDRAACTPIRDAFLHTRG